MQETERALGTQLQEGLLLQESFKFKKLLPSPLHFLILSLVLVQSLIVATFTAE